MKRLLFLSLSLLVISACEVIDNGKLEGNWHLYQIDTLATGGCLDMSEANVCWGVQGHLLQTYSDIEAYMFHFDYSNDSLILRDAFYRDRLVGDVVMTDSTVSEMYGYGISCLAPRYKIIRLDRRYMNLQDQTIRLSFERY